MDISSIQPKSRKIEIIHPTTEEPIGVRFFLLPDTDPKVKKVQRDIQNRQFNKRKGKITAEQIEANNMERLVSAVDGWEWYGEGVNFEGEIPEFTEENVRRVLKKVPFIKEQVMDEFNDREAFYKG